MTISHYAALKLSLRNGVCWPRRAACTAMAPPLFSISPLVFDAGITNPVDLYIHNATDSSQVLVLSAGDVLDFEKLSRIAGKRLLASADTDHKRALWQFFRQQLETCLGDCGISPLRRAAVIVEALRGDVVETFASRSTRRIAAISLLRERHPDT